MLANEPMSSRLDVRSIDSAFCMIRLAPGAAGLIARHAVGHAANSLLDATPMRREDADAVRSTLKDEGALDILGPMISVHRATPAEYRDFTTDDFFGLPPDQRHIGPVKVFVADQGPLSFAVEPTAGSSPKTCDVAHGDAVLVFVERTRYRVVTDTGCIVVHAFL